MKKKHLFHKLFADYFLLNMILIVNLVHFGIMIAYTVWNRMDYRYFAIHFNTLGGVWDFLVFVAKFLLPSVLAVVFAVLYKFGFPIITSMIEARKQYIDEALKGAKEANEKIANIEQQCNGLIEEARQRQVEILREATAAREQIIRETREKADAETAKIVADAKREIEQQRQDALNSLREEAAKVAIAVSEKILRKELTSQASQQEYIGKLVDETEKELKAAKDK